jgi:alcohol dehydrogenase YqhD (iron-dependent ADH family)
MENGKQPAFAMLDPNGSYTQYGLTKREYFAGLAMQGILAHESFYDRMCNETGENTIADRLATASVKMADKLLAELDKA